MRLYETTGIGALLITDYKNNLSNIFEIGKEVIAYHSTEECNEIIGYYLEHKKEADDIAKSGQKRTLGKHTYFHRMQEFTEIVNVLSA